MFKLSTAINTAATLLLLLASSIALAGELLIIDEPLASPPTGYELYKYASTGSTADFKIGDLGGSNGLIFDGTWNVPANGTADSLGELLPDFEAPVDFDLDPSDIGGFTYVHWTLDAEVISDTMNTTTQGIFASLFIYQQQGNGAIRGFATGGQLVLNEQSVAIEVRYTASDFGPVGSRPDFSATGRPMSFALQLGARYPKEIQPEAFFIDGRMTAQNWTVSVSKEGEIFSDSFESQIPINVNAAMGSVKLLDEENCLCPAPVPATMLPPRIR